MTTSSEFSSSSRGSTRCFWLGYLVGGIVGLGLGALMGDIIGWSYMCGTVGCIAALAFDRSGR